MTDAPTGTVYIVHGVQGFYDNERDWIVCACLTQELAEAWVLRLQTAVDALCTRDTFDGRIVYAHNLPIRGPVDGDPESYFTEDGGQPQYEVIETKIRVDGPTPAVLWKEEITEGAPSEHRYRSIMPDNVSLVAYDHGDWYVVGPNSMERRDIEKGSCLCTGSKPRVEFAKEHALQAYLAWKRANP